MGPALQAAFLVINHVGGKLLLFQVCWGEAKRHPSKKSCLFFIWPWFCCVQACDAEPGFNALVPKSYRLAAHKSTLLVACPMACYDYAGGITQPGHWTHQGTRQPSAVRYRSRVQPAHS